MRSLRGIRELLAGLWRASWRRAEPGAPAGGHAEYTSDPEGGDLRRMSDARRRFWSELRAGQREAELHSARLRP